MSINDTLSRHDLATFFRRFETKFIPEPMSGCWLWERAVNAAGYGWTDGGDRPELAHRMSWVLYRGPIPFDSSGELLNVLHKCDNPPCVNPDHLFVGTMADNVADRGAKGRTRVGHGLRHWKVKLTEEEVREIFYANGSYESIGATYGVTGANVRYIKQGVIWKHLKLKKL